MSTRINIKKLQPKAYDIMLAFEDYMESTSLSALDKELIKVRASQINGCTYCIDMHTQDARKAGETEQRLYLLAAWRDTPFFTDEERAMLSLVEEVTKIANGVSDEVYLKALKILGEQKVSEVIMATIIINGWNRIGISTRMEPAASLTTA
jgi:AhpD family alkylhydroperoxidase